MTRLARRPRPAGMTLTELLVVLAIILLISAATLPTAMVALSEREVSDAAGSVQAMFSLTRDRATATGEPAGIRLLPDPENNLPGGILAANRMVPLSQPPSYSEGEVIPVIEVDNVPIAGGGTFTVRRLAVYEAKVDVLGAPATPTSWYFNIRQGDTLRFEGSSLSYTIVGPMTIGPRTTDPAVGNPERFVNETLDGQINGDPVQSIPVTTYAAHIERLHLLNGRDDPSPVAPLASGNTVENGYVDEAFDGIDNNNDQGLVNGLVAFVDPGFNGVDDNGNNVVDEPIEMILVNTGTAAVANPLSSEYEIEQPAGGVFHLVRIGGEVDSSTGIPILRDPGDLTVPISLFDSTVPRLRYTITRRPLVAPDAREIALPGGAVIDLTTSVLELDGVDGTRSERSRVPVDPVTGYVDLIVAPNGQVYPSLPFRDTKYLSVEFPLFYLWVAERRDLAEPFVATPELPIPPRLPITREAANAVGRNYPRVLEGERRLVVISPKTGHASVSEVGGFTRIVTDASGNQTEVLDINVPYAEALRTQQTGE